MRNPTTSQFLKKSWDVVFYNRLEVIVKYQHRLFSLFALFVIVTVSSAQQSVLDSLRARSVNSGTVKGMVRHIDTKEGIPFTNILIKGSSWGASSNENGEFTMTKIP